jgi:site-specific DNA-methyltransferase (adenine-specific)
MSDSRRGTPNAGPLPVGQVLVGDCLQLLQTLPEQSIDLVFADPPYNLQLRQELWRPNQTRVDAVDDAWDRFEGFGAYDAFSRAWLQACWRVLKPQGSLWVIGTYHNIFRLGTILQDLGYWILNDIVWIKTNPMPNFRGVRFTNAHETLIWAARSREAPYTFHHHAMKALNDELQMRSDWELPVCGGKERLRLEGKKAHPTQKPEALVYRVLMAASSPGDLVLDPFFGTGTTGLVAKRLRRQWVGIEQDAGYAEMARQRIAGEPEPAQELELFQPPPGRRSSERIPFGRLLESGLLRTGQLLYFQHDRNRIAAVTADGRLIVDGFSGSIHQVGRQLSGGAPCNGWDAWHYEDATGELRSIDYLREMLRARSTDDPSAGEVD